MKITYNKNPLYTTIELNEAEKKELWYQVKIKEMEELLCEAHFHLQEDKYFDLARAREEVDLNYLFSTEEGKKSSLDERCDMMFNYYINELMSNHVGDCTCVASSCLKCHAEDLVGTKTIAGLGKHNAHRINAAFGKNNEKTIDEAIEYLANYNPVPTESNSEAWKKLGGYEQYIPRWKEEARVAHDWLVEYKNKYLKN